MSEDEVTEPIPTAPPRPPKLRHIVGAFVHGRRVGDKEIRHKASLLTRWGLAGFVVVAWVWSGNARDREVAAERRAQADASAVREERLMATFDRLSSSIDRLGASASEERAACTGLRDQILNAYGERIKRATGGGR